MTVFLLFVKQIKHTYEQEHSATLMDGEEVSRYEVYEDNANSKKKKK